MQWITPFHAHPVTIFSLFRLTWWSVHDSQMKQTKESSSNCGILGCGTVQLRRQAPTFRRNMVPLSSGSNRLGWGAIRFIVRLQGKWPIRSTGAYRSETFLAASKNCEQEITEAKKQKWFLKAVFFKLFSRVPLSQHRTCTSATTAIHCKYYRLLSWYWSSWVFRCENLKFRSCYSSKSTRIDDKGVLYLYRNNEIADLSW